MICISICWILISLSFSFSLSRCLSLSFFLSHSHTFCFLMILSICISFSVSSFLMSLLHQQYFSSSSSPFFLYPSHFLILFSFLWIWNLSAQSSIHSFFLSLHVSISLSILSFSLNGDFFRLAMFFSNASLISLTASIINRL